MKKRFIISNRTVMLSGGIKRFMLGAKKITTNRK